MAVTEVSSRSWLADIATSFKGLFVAIPLFVGSFFLLWWNEGCAVTTAKSLQEGQGAVLSVANERVDPANEHRLVHLSGNATTTETLSDPEFKIARNAIRLRRTVEIYQWKETKETERRDKSDDASDRVTTYTYTKEWSSEPIDSATFRESGHYNLRLFPFSQHEEKARQVTLGAFQLPAALVSKMDMFEPVPVDERAFAEVPATTRARATEGARRQLL
jgi:hypothetical protein